MKHARERMIEDMKLRGLAPRTQARYLHAIKALAEHYHRPLCRIISVDDGKVTFRYKVSGSAQAKTMTVSAEEFIRRLLQHVLPAGLHKVRYYDLWSPSDRENLYRVQQILTRSGNDQQVPIAPNRSTDPPSNTI